MTLSWLSTLVRILLLYVRRWTWARWKALCLNFQKNMMFAWFKAKLNEIQPAEWGLHFLVRVFCRRTMKPAISNGKSHSRCILTYFWYENFISELILTSTQRDYLRFASWTRNLWRVKSASWSPKTWLISCESNEMDFRNGISIPQIPQESWCAWEHRRCRPQASSMWSRWNPVLPRMR